TPQSRHLIGAAELEALPDHAYLINVGRGDLVDDAALEAALRAGKLAGALLDAFTVEPLPKGHPYWSNPKVLVTPHLAGFHRVAVEQFLDNLGRFCRA